MPQHARHTVDFRYRTTTDVEPGETLDHAVYRSFVPSELALIGETIAAIRQAHDAPDIRYDLERVATLIALALSRMRDLDTTESGG